MRCAGSAKCSENIVYNFAMPAAQRIVIKGGTLIDGTGKPPVASGAIVVEGNKIVQVDQAARAAQPSDTVIDATGKWIMPGLIDGHVHLSSHQGQLPGVRYASTPEYATLWTARVVG